MDISSVPIVILTLLPGFLGLFLFRWFAGYKPSRQHSDFVLSLGLSLVALIAGYALANALTAIGVLHLIGPGNDLASMVRDASKVPGSVLWAQYTLSVLGGLGLGSLWSSKWLYRKYRRSPFDFFRQEDTWRHLTREPMYLIVRTKSGVVLSGWPRHSGWDMSDAALYLEDIEYLYDEEEWRPQPDMMGVYIPGEQIALIEVPKGPNRQFFER